jgi:hypothetical protein
MTELLQALSPLLSGQRNGGPVQANGFCQGLNCNNKMSVGQNKLKRAGKQSLYQRSLETGRQDPLPSGRWDTAAIYNYWETRVASCPTTGTSSHNLGTVHLPPSCRIRNQRTEGWF